MLEFFCSNNVRYDINKILLLNYSELLSEEHKFCIKIDGKVFFEQPYFPIVELLYHYAMWDRKKSFIYNSIESNENPLLSFKQNIIGWKIDSVWKKFECKEHFCLDDIITAFESLCNKTGDGSTV